MSDDILKAMKAKWGDNKKPKQIKINDNKKTDQRPTNLIEKKTFEEVRKLQIANEQSINNLIPKTMIKSMLGEISQSLRTNFIDLPRRESPTLAAKWGIQNLERDVEFDIAEIIEKGLSATIETIERLCQEEYFE